MRCLLFTILAVLLCYQPSSSAIAQEIVVRHYQHQARYQLGLKILNLALSKLEQPYKIQTPKEQYVNEKRGEQQVIDGKLDLQWMSTTIRREQVMIPVKVPLYKGILGLRLLLVKRERQEELSRISTIDDLRKYIAGHGTHWGDLPIYKTNDLNVITNVNYEKLFQQLYLGRFDYFHRGLNEIWTEQKLYSNTLQITDNVMLFYPLPVYFFVSKERPELAQQIEQGLKIAVEDGSYRKLFLENFGEDIARARLQDRELIILKNDDLSTGTRINNIDWWLPKKFLSQVSIKTN